MEPSDVMLNFLEDIAGSLKSISDNFQHLTSFYQRIAESIEHLATIMKRNVPCTHVVQAQGVPERPPEPRLLKLGTENDPQAATELQVPFRSSVITQGTLWTFLRDYNNKLQKQNLSISDREKQYRQVENACLQKIMGESDFNFFRDHMDKKAAQRLLSPQLAKRIRLSHDGLIG
ncbi:hypothetical protein CHUAL_010697 [Chamberlinius hualienensis]